MVAVKRNIAKSCGAGPTVQAHASPAAPTKSSRSASLKSSSSAAKTSRFLRQKAAGVPTRPIRAPRGRIPRAAAWGWLHTPVPNRIMFFGVLFGLVSVTTPYWASVKSSFSGYASFGIWHFCVGDEPCSSIHENLLPGKRVPGKYFEFTPPPIHFLFNCFLCLLPPPLLCHTPFHYISEMFTATSTSQHNHHNIAVG